MSFSVPTRRTLSCARALGAAATSGNSAHAVSHDPLLGHRISLASRSLTAVQLQREFWLLATKYCANRWGHELDEQWLASVGGLDKKWKAFAENEGAAVDRIRVERELLPAGILCAPEDLLQRHSRRKR